MTRTIDLDAGRAARAEARQDDAAIIEVGGDAYVLGAELPVAALDGFARAQGGDTTGLIDALKALFGDETYSELLGKHELSVDDLGVILADAFGVDTEAALPLAPSSGSPTP